MALNIRSAMYRSLSDTISTSTNTLSLFTAPSGDAPYSVRLYMNLDFGTAGKGYLELRFNGDSDNNGKPLTFIDVSYMPSGTSATVFYKAGAYYLNTPNALPFTALIKKDINYGELSEFGTFSSAFKTADFDGTYVAVVIAVPGYAINMSGDSLAVHNLTAEGTISGNGSGITQLNGSSISTGTVNSERLPLASKTTDGIINTATQAFSGSKTFASGITTENSVLHATNGSSSHADYGYQSIVRSVSGGTSFTLSLPTKAGDIAITTDITDITDTKQDKLSVAQIAAANSGITTDKVSTYDAHVASTSNPHSVTKSQVGLGNADNTSDLAKPISTATKTALDAKANDTAVVHLTGDETIAGTKTLANEILLSPNQAYQIDGVGLSAYDGYPHIATPNSKVAFARLGTNDVTFDFSGVIGSETLTLPTTGGTLTLLSQVTKSQVGLENADNTSDLSKPISTATQTALDAKANAAALASHVGNTANPHSVTKSQVGLGNVDNTSDLNKPISTATQTALNAKIDAAIAASTYATASSLNALDASAVKLSGTQTISGNKIFTSVLNTGDIVSSGNIQITGNAVIGGNLTISGTTTTVNSSTLEIADNLLVLAKGNTASLTWPAGIIVPKYDGTNYGGLFFDSTGTAYVGDVALATDGKNIDIAAAGTTALPLSLRSGAFTDSHIVIWNGAKNAITDGGVGIETAVTSTNASLPTGKAVTDYVTGLNYSTTRGTVTSIGMTMPDGLSVSPSTITSSGTFAVSLASGYAIPTTAAQTEWSNAYSSWNADNAKWSAAAAAVDGKITASSGVVSASGALVSAGAVADFVNGKGYSTTTGTVTSVSASASGGISVGGSPITSAGTISIGIDSGHHLPTTSDAATWNATSSDVSDNKANWTSAYNSLSNYLPLTAIATGAKKLNTGTADMTIGNARTPVCFVNGVPQPLTISGTIDGDSLDIDNIATKPIYIDTSGVIHQCSAISVGGSVDSATNATNASCLKNPSFTSTLSSGSVSKPVYFKNGVPAECGVSFTDITASNSETVEKVSVVSGIATASASFLTDSSTAGVTASGTKSLTGVVSKTDATAVGSISSVTIPVSTAYSAKKLTITIGTTASVVSSSVPVVSSMTLDTAATVITGGAATKASALTSCAATAADVLHYKAKA